MGQRYLKKGVERKNSEDRIQETGDWSLESGDRI